MKLFRLTAADGTIYESLTPGELGGHRPGRIYGRLDCRSALAALPKGYARHRVFFANETAAIAAGYRPCAKCMGEQYKKWKGGGQPATATYPWKALPRAPKPKAGDAATL